MCVCVLLCLHSHFNIKGTFPLNKAHKRCIIHLPHVTFDRQCYLLLSPALSQHKVQPIALHFN